jgi:hypothetical protein
MLDVVPSFYEFRSEQEMKKYDGLAFDNYILRVGEVKKILWPEDQGSRSKQFIEYNVYVAHRENGTAISKMYENCLRSNPLAGLADKFFATLRVDPKAGVTKDSKQDVVDGVGSKVLLLCINAEHASAIVVGGIRDSRDNDKGRKARGHHLEFVFNGTTFEIRDDGSCQLTMGGKTQADGTADPARDTDGAGSVIELKANGNIEARTPKDAQTVVIDHKAGTIKINAKKGLTLTADRINLGDGAPEKAVLGETLVDLLGQLIDLISQQTHLTAMGTSSPPLNVSQFKLLKTKLKTALSQFVFVKKSKR